MASVTVQKHTLQAASAGQVAHLYRLHEHYGNDDVNPDLSGDNVYYGTAEECRKLMHDTIAAIDARHPPKRVRADRKVVAELCYPAPRADTPPEDAEIFFDVLKSELEARGYHVVGGAVHEDERHEYVDPDTRAKTMSRTHAQFLVIPETCSKGLNMKSWLTKSRYRELNEIADFVCQSVLGHDYQDGSRQKSRGNVEKLKTASAVAEREELDKSLEAARAELARLKVDADKARADAQADERRATEFWDAIRNGVIERDDLDADLDILRAQQAKDFGHAHAIIERLETALKPADVEILDTLPEKRTMTGKIAKPERVVISKEAFDWLRASAATPRLADSIIDDLRTAANWINKVNEDARTAAHKRYAAYEREFANEAEQRTYAAENRAQEAEKRAGEHVERAAVGDWLWEHDYDTYDNICVAATRHHPEVKKFIPREPLPERQRTQTERQIKARKLRSHAKNHGQAHGGQSGAADGDLEL